MVVGQHGSPQPGRRGEVAVGSAEVDHRRTGRVVHVLRVTYAVRVHVDARCPPGRRQQLERADRPVPEHVAVPAAPVGVADGGVRRPVEHRSEDGRTHPVTGVDLPVGEVAALDLADRGEQRGGHVARRWGCRDCERVGAEQVVRQLVESGRAGGRPEGPARRPARGRGLYDHRVGGPRRRRRRLGPVGQRARRRGLRRGSSSHAVARRRRPAEGGAGERAQHQGTHARPSFHPPRLPRAADAGRLYDEPVSKVSAGVSGCRPGSAQAPGRVSSAAAPAGRGPPSRPCGATRRRRPRGGVVR